jgi:hypothetical protein
MGKTGLALGTVLLLAASALARPAKNGSKDASHVVDSGTFGVFVNGQRVATETFSIEQDATGSVVTSQFKSAPGVDDASQSSELQLASNSSLVKYEWKELSPDRVEAVVAPDGNFLMERTNAPGQKKPQEQPFLLPPSTVILDDYFFVDREILAWKYLATSCRRDNGQLQCPVNRPTQFGALNPHSRSSMMVSVEFAKREAVTIGGKQRELNRFTLRNEGDEWSLWLDDQFKLIRIDAGNTQVVRD